MRSRWFSPLSLVAAMLCCTAGALAAPLTIRWDDAHDLDGDALDTNYADFAAVVADEGHLMTPLDAPGAVLDAAALTDVDVLVIFDAEDPFTAAEISAVQAWVTAGGRLFLTGDIPSAFDQPSNNALLAGSGLSFTNDNMVGDLTVLTPDPLTAGMTSIDFLIGSAVTVAAGPGTKVLAQTAAGKVGYASGVGGKVVVLTDSNALDNTSNDSSPFALGANEERLVRNLLAHFEALVPVPPVLEITIDIKPGQTSNEVEPPSPLNPNSKGVVPVAILTTAIADGEPLDFDPWDSVDVDTLRLGPGEAPIVDAQGGAEDVDQDGDLDMVVHFSVPDIGVVCGDDQLTLRGETFDGDAIEGSDEIVTPGCK